MEHLDEILELSRRGDIAAFEAAVDAVDNSSLRHWLRASHADLLGEYERAIALYRVALSESDAPALVTSGAPVRICSNLKSLGDIDGAIIEGEQHLVALTVMDPYPFDDVIELKSILANMYSSRGEMSRAISLTSEQPPHTETGILRAQWGWSRSVVLFQAGFINEAIAASMEAVAAINRYAHPNFVVGIDSNIWWMRSVNSERFNDDEITRIKSRIDDERRIGRSFMADELTLVLGFARANRGESEMARETIDELMSRSSLSSAGLVRAATVLSAAGFAPAAQSTYRAALELLDAESQPVLAASVWRTLAASYESDGDTAAAIECLKAAIEAAGIVSSPSADPLCITI